MTRFTGSARQVPGVRGWVAVVTDHETGENLEQVGVFNQDSSYGFYSERIAHGLAESQAARCNQRGFVLPMREVRL